MPKIKKRKHSRHLERLETRQLRLQQVRNRASYTRANETADERQSRLDLLRSNAAKHEEMKAQKNASQGLNSSETILQMRE